MCIGIGRVRIELNDPEEGLALNKAVKDYENRPCWRRSKARILLKEPPHSPIKYLLSKE